MPIAKSQAEDAESLAAPIGELIASVGRGLVHAQQAMDVETLQFMRRMHSGDDPELAMLVKLGYQPTWYRIPELSAELAVSLSMHSSSADSGSGKTQLFIQTMDASYTNKYDVDMSVASTIRFKIVPVPPSAQAMDRKLVPNLIDKTFARARRLLSDMGIEGVWNLDHPPLEDAKVASCEPAPGEFLSPGQKVVLTF